MTPDARRWALALVAVYTLLLLLRGTAWHGAGVDQVLYHAQATTVVWDGDVDLLDDVLLSRSNRDLRVDVALGLYPEGRPNLPFPVGPSVVYTPFLLLLRGLDALLGGALLPAGRMDYLARLVPSLATWVVVLGGLLALFRVGCRMAPPGRVFAVVLATFLGTNLCYYTWHETGMAHGLAFGFVASAVWASVRFAEAPGWRRALAMGALAGAATAMRWQDALVAVFPMAALLAARVPKPEARLRLGVYTAVAALVPLLPQLCQWTRLYGAPVAVPQGGGFFVWGWERLSDLLYSRLNGWFYSHPMAAALLVGAGMLAVRGPWWARAGLVYTMLTVFVNTLAGDWWAGGSFGQRRFVSVLAVLMPGGLHLFREDARRAVRACQGILAGVLAILAAANLALVFRLQYVDLLPGWWHAMEREWPLWLSLLASDADFHFASDLFVRPESGVALGLVRGAFLLSVGAVGIAGAAVVWWWPRLVDFFAGRRGAVLLAASIVYTGLMGGAWLVLPDASGGHPARWLGGIKGDTRPIPWATLEESAAAYLEDHAGAEFPAVFALGGAIRERDLARANRLTELLDQRFLLVARELWMAGGTYRMEERDEAVEWLAGRPVLPASTREEVARLLREQGGREELLRTVTRNAGGPSWRTVYTRYEDAWWGNERVGKWMPQLRGAAARNPFHQVARLRLVESLPVYTAEARGHAGALRRITDASFDHALYLAEVHPELVSILVLQWRWALAHRADLAWRLGDVEDLERTAAIARRVAAEDVAAGIGERLEWLKKWERRRREGPGSVAHPSGLETAATVIPEEALRQVRAEWLRREAGWGVFEAPMDKALPGWRWSESRIALAPLDGPLEPGRYHVNVRGLRFGTDSIKPTMTVEFLGEEDRAFPTIGTEYFHLVVPLWVSERRERPILRFHCRLDAPADIEEESVDERLLGFLLSDLWVTPVPALPGE